MTMIQNNEALLMSAAALGVSAAVAMAVVLHCSSSRKNKNLTVLVFRDVGNTTSTSDHGDSKNNAGTSNFTSTHGISSNAVQVHFPDIAKDKTITLASLKSSIAAALFADAQERGGEGEEAGRKDSVSNKEMRLFMQDTKEEVLDLAAVLRRQASGDYKRGFYDNSGARGAVVLVCTFHGRDLSVEAQSMQPLERFPAPSWVPELPMGFGHILAYTRGSRKLRNFNAYDNLFRGKPDKTLRIKQFPYRVDDRMNSKLYDIDYGPQEDEGLVLTTDPDMLSELLARQQDFPKMWTSFRERKVGELAPTGLFTSSTHSKDWQTAHGILPKYFNAIRITHYYPRVLEKTQSFVQQWINLGDGKVVDDVEDWLTCMTADAVIKASMDYDMQCVERKAAGQPLHPFLVSFRYCIRYMSLQLKGNKKELAVNYAKHRKVLDDFVDELVEKTRHHEIGGPLSFLTGMLESRSTTNGEFLPLKDFFGHVINIMVAGHETTAATLGFCLAELARHPECLAKAVKEIESVLGNNSSPTYEDIGRLQYVEACFREALRMYPPVQELKRECATDTVVLGKYLLRKGQRITIPTYGLHRQKEQWDQGVFGDPEEFNPYRHLPGAPVRHANAQAPFGFGVRACIGMQFALLEAKTFLCMILNNFTIQTPPDFQIVPTGAALSPSCHNLTLILRTRPNAPLPGVNLFTDPSSTTESSKPSRKASAPEKEDLSPPKKSREKPILILFGSNTGTCEDFARMLSERAADEGYNSQVATLDQAVGKNMLTTGTPGPVLFITSTYNGMPPDNAQKFAKWMENDVKPDSLTGTKFAVFGVGNSNWSSTYQKFPTEIDSCLAGAGATPLKALTTADASMAGFADSFEDWAQAVLEVIANELGMETTKEPETAPKTRSTYIRLLDATTANQVGEPARDAPAFRQKLYDVFDQRSLVPESPQHRFEPCLVTKTIQLQSEYSDRSTCHIELALPDGTSYEAGDHLAVIGCNSDLLVNSALEALGLTGDEIVLCNPSQTALERGIPHDLPLIPVTARLALTWLPDLGAPPSRKNIQRLADAYCRCPPEAAALRALVDENQYKEVVLNNSLTLAELLTKYRSIRMNMQDFCSLLPRINARYYSISSSPLVAPNRVSITVGLVQFQANSGRYHRGAASSMLHAKEVGGMVLCKVKQLNGKFKLPKDSTTPIIMVGPGTGVAPFMGFLEEREVLLAKQNSSDNNTTALGPCHLFFGCRSKTTDFIYQDRLEAYTKNGVLSSNGLHVAFSRQEPGSNSQCKKVYVQDLIAANSSELWKVMTTTRDNSNGNGDSAAAAVVYICGDAKRMAPDVKQAFIHMAIEHGPMTRDAAEHWMTDLMSSGRYLEDVYA